MYVYDDLKPCMRSHLGFVKVCVCVCVCVCLCVCEVWVHASVALDLISEIISVLGLNPRLVPGLYVWDEPGS